MKKDPFYFFHFLDENKGNKDVCDAMKTPPVHFLHCCSHRGWWGPGAHIRAGIVPVWNWMHTTSEFKAANVSPHRQSYKSALATLIFAPSEMYLCCHWRFLFLPAGLEDSLHPACGGACGPGDDTTKRWVTSAQLLHLLQWVKRFLVGILMTDVHQKKRKASSGTESSD